MPKVREYGAPNLEYQGGQVTASGGLEFSGAKGRAVQEFGQAVQNAGEQIYRRQEQEETSNLNAQFAELSADVSTEIDEATQNGTIDPQKYAETVRERADKLSENISTRGGRVAFERNSAMVQSQAIKRSVRGKAAVDGANAVANMTTVVAKHSSALLTDPSGYDGRSQMVDHAIDDAVTYGNLPAGAAAKIRNQAQKDLVMSSIRGWAAMGPTGPDLAEKQLHSGKYDGQIDGDQKAQLQRDINTQRSANLTELQREEALKNKTEKLQRKAWLAKNLDAINAGTISAKEIQSAPGDEDGSKNRQLLEVVRKTAKDGGGTPDPAVISDVHSRMLLPDGDPRKIVDESQIFDLVGKGLTTNDAKDAIGDLADTPDGKAMRASQASALAVAKKTILQRGIMYYGSGVNSGASQQNLENWIKDTRSLRNQYLNDGKNVSELYNSKSPAYVGSPEFLKQYQIQTNTAPYFNSQAQETIKNQPAFTGAPDPGVRQKKADGTLESYSEWKARQPK